MKDKIIFQYKTVWQHIVKKHRKPKFGTVIADCIMLAHLSHRVRHKRSEKSVHKNTF